VVTDDIIERRGRLVDEVIDNLNHRIDALERKVRQWEIIAERLANSDRMTDREGWEYAIISYEEMVRN
jgi:hypothetical protein